MGCRVWLLSLEQLGIPCFERGKVRLWSKLQVMLTVALRWRKRSLAVDALKIMLKTCHGKVVNCPCRKFPWGLAGPSGSSTSKGNLGGKARRMLHISRVCPSTLSTCPHCPPGTCQAISCASSTRCGWPCSALSTMCCLLKSHMYTFPLPCWP